MVAAASDTGAPQVSIIVPARNEELSLPACLDSLTAQQGVSFEIVVVDDGSTDRTRDIAEGFPAVRVVPSGPLPSGWSGKSNAIMSGVRAARGEWLLFTDADTSHLPGSLQAAVHEAQTRKIDLLSYSPAQDIHGFWQSAVMPVIFAELAAHYRPKEVSDPASPQAAANGQYILVRRDAYDAVGGHARVALTLLEDVALASMFKLAGRRIFFRYGSDRVRTRMYRTWSDMRDGWTKNLALLFPATAELALLRIAEALLIAAGSLIAIFEAGRGNTSRAVAAGALAVLFIALFCMRVRKAHFPLRSELLAPLGLPVFAWLLLRSQRAYKKGTVVWKGRAYSPAAKVQVPAAPLVQIASTPSRTEEKAS